MFNVDIARKRVDIAHTVRTLDGRVELTTTFDLCDVPEEKVLLWVATNRLTHSLAGKSRDEPTHQRRSEEAFRQPCDRV